MRKHWLVMVGVLACAVFVVVLRWVNAESVVRCKASCAPGYVYVSGSCPVGNTVACTPLDCIGKITCRQEATNSEIQVPCRCEE